VIRRNAHPPPPSAHDPVRSPRGPDVFKALSGPLLGGAGLAPYSRSPSAPAGRAPVTGRRSRMRTASMRLSRTDSTRIE
jgi:hypothetical protein